MFTKELLCVFTCLVFACLQALSQEPSEKFEPGVLFTGTSLPTPPSQGQAWKPPASKFSEKWISAMEELFGHGFADPRGCEYREVKFTYSSSIWGGSFLITTHAWVIPQDAGKKRDAQRFAVTWDGLVYPVAKLGPPKDLKADVEALRNKSAEETVRYKNRRFAFIGSLGAGVEEFSYAYNRPHQMREWPERELVSCRSLLAIKTCLLLRLGETQLASQVLGKWLSRDSAILQESPSADDPYMVFAWEWTWALFDRALGAHLRGDDVVAMHAAKMLVPFAEAVPRTAEKRGFHRFRRGGTDYVVPFLTLHDPPARLLEESTRRVKAGPFRTALETGLDKFPDQSRRIAALIHDLETVSAGPEYGKGGVPIGPPRISYMPSGLEQGPPVNPLKVSPVVQALIKEGQPAVEPLLECLVNDRRLTRVAGLNLRGFLPERDFIGVDLAAYAALCGILKADGFGPLTEEGYYHDCQGESDAADGGRPALAFHYQKPFVYERVLVMRSSVAEEIRRRFERVKGRPSGRAATTKSAKRS